MEISEAWPDTSDEGYIHQFQPEPTCKILYQQKKLWVYRYPPMEHLSGGNKDHPNQHKNSHKQCDETEDLVLSLLES